MHALIVTGPSVQLAVALRVRTATTLVHEEDTVQLPRTEAAAGCMAVAADTMLSALKHASRSVKRLFMSSTSLVPHLLRAELRPGRAQTLPKEGTRLYRS
jgi:hypothetical protein